MVNKIKQMFSSLFRNNEEAITLEKVIVNEVAINDDSIYKQAEGFNVEEIKFLKSLVDQPIVIEELMSGMEAKIRIIEALKGSITDDETLAEVEKGLEGMRSNIETLKKSAILAESVTKKLDKLIDVID